MLYYLATFIYVAVCLVLILVVLLQQGKGGDIANAFGGGASQAAFGARSGATVLSRATTVCAVLFIVGAVVLGILGQRGPGSVIGGRAPQGATLPTGATLPAGAATPAPAPAGTTTPAPAVPATATPAAATPAPAVPAPAQ
jgi:preprotein translocase subunit SecG